MKRIVKIFWFKVKYFLKTLSEFKIRIHLVYFKDLEVKMESIENKH